MSIKRVSDIIKSEEIEKWSVGEIVTITADCGAGKSYFIKNTLYDYAKSCGRKILMLLPRKAPVMQFKSEVEKDGKKEHIDIFTYQYLETITSNNSNFNLDKYSYIVCDEFHYFVSDVGFNPKSIISFETVMKCTNAVKVFMSAFASEMKSTLYEIDLFKECELHEYVVPYKLDRINNLYFFNKDSTVESLLQDFINNNQKAIFFMQKGSLAYELYKNHCNHCLFLCAAGNAYYKYVDIEKIRKMLINEHFEEQVLITTGCFDAGTNIIDEDITKIVTDISDVNSLLQYIGRKRIQNPCDKIDLYIKSLSNKQLGGFIKKKRDSIDKSNYLRETSQDKFILKYVNHPDTDNIVFQYKRINELMFNKQKYNIQLYSDMIKAGNFGYCRYLQNLLGKEEYIMLNEDCSLEAYLDSLVRDKKVMLNLPDRHELIERINFKSGGHLRKNINLLNNELKRRGFTYSIEEFKTSKTINGVSKRYNHAWKVVKLKEL